MKSIACTWKFAGRTVKKRTTSNPCYFHQSYDRIVHTVNSSMSLEVKTVSTSPYNDQKLGTSGLRKPVALFLQQNYTENFVQSILNSISSDESCTLVLGGDGRYYCKEACEIIIRMCAANGIGKVIVGKDAIFSTPAVSVVIRKYKLTGGIILTASHNPGGPDGDFGIKYNTSSGGAAPPNLTNEIFEVSKSLSEYYIVPGLTFDLSTFGVQDFDIMGRTFVIEVIDPVKDYVELMTKLFDFCALSNLLHGHQTTKPFPILIDSLHGVTGPYVKKIFVDMLGTSPNNVRNVVPLKDFGAKHPDPNLTYAADLVDAMKDGIYEFGAAFDGDGDRCMVLGFKGFFVNPSDSVAVLADNLECIAYYKNTIKGFARSMPTSTALDRVCATKNKEMYETPTGWKFFINLMEDGRITLCGEESFGIGSDHIREKDGIWAVLAWLSVVIKTNMSIENILRNHWKKYGRNFFMRHDYECCDSEKSQQMLEKFEEIVQSSDFIGREYRSSSENIYKVKEAHNFSYTDPVDGSVATKEGLRVIFDNDSRFIVRLSGTGSTGATIRLYFDLYESDPEKYSEDPQNKLQDLVDIALNTLNLKEFTGRSQPTVIT